MQTVEEIKAEALFAIFDDVMDAVAIEPKIDGMQLWREYMSCVSHLRKKAHESGEPDCVWITHRELIFFFSGTFEAMFDKTRPQESVQEFRHILEWANMIDSPGQRKGFNQVLLMGEILPWKYAHKYTPRAWEV